MFMTKIWPVIEISGRFFVCGHKICKIFRPRIFGLNGRNFDHPADPKLKFRQKMTQNAILKNYINDHNLAGNENFWPIFCGRTEIIIFWPEKKKFHDSAEISALGSYLKSNFSQIWSFFEFRTKT